MRGAGAVAALERDRRIRELPRRCSMVLQGLDNSENDVALVFEGLTFGETMAVASRESVVYAAFHQLKPADLERLFGMFGISATRPPRRSVSRPTTAPAPRPPRLGGVAL